MAALVHSRRKFLYAIIGGTAALAGLWRYLKPVPRPKKVIVTVEVSAVPADAALVFTDERVAVARGTDGFYAVSLVCTHLGCTVSVTPDGLFCPCHGSKFDRGGKVMQGPATVPLQRLAVEVSGGKIIVSG